MLGADRRETRAGRPATGHSRDGCEVPVKPFRSRNPIAVGAVTALVMALIGSATFFSD
ncbi:MAG TPA: ABC transporter substrate-binding protein, partial [Amycolatopsis sp.]|nr:ABC transporter substrate-binding protein [Amycolatopsis sp.]